MSLWQLAKDKKRRVAQKLAERRRSSTDPGDGSASTVAYYQADPQFLEERASFKEYVKASKTIQKKVAAVTAQALAFSLAIKDLAEALDEYEGGEQSSRGDSWLLSMDQFNENAQANVEAASTACLESIRARYGVSQESLAAVKRLKDRETDLRSYERRVAEGKAKANPKPEFIAKFTAKQESAAADVARMTAAVKSDLQLMESTRLSAHQPAFDEYCNVLSHVCQQAGKLLEPPQSKSGKGASSFVNSLLSGAGEKVQAAKSLIPDFSSASATGATAAAMANRPMPSVPSLPVDTNDGLLAPSKEKVPPKRKSLSGKMSAAQMKDRISSAGTAAAQGIAAGAASVSSAAAAAVVSAPPNKKAPSPPSRSVPPLPAKPAKSGDQSASKPPAAIAKFAFKPEAEDELKLDKGDEIFDIAKVEDDWYRGTTKNGTGIFPANYVNIL